MKSEGVLLTDLCTSSAFLKALPSAMEDSLPEFPRFPAAEKQSEPLTILHLFRRIERAHRNPPYSKHCGWTLTKDPPSTQDWNSAYFADSCSPVPKIASCNVLQERNDALVKTSWSDGVFKAPGASKSTMKVGLTSCSKYSRSSTDSKSCIPVL